MLLDAPQLGKRIVQAPEPTISLAGTRFRLGQRRFENPPIPKAERALWASE